MAKRKRLTPPNPVWRDEPAGALPGPFAAPRNAPIADVARDAAGSAAFDELAETLARARAEGRMLLPLALDLVQLDYLVRDRLVVNDEDMAALKDSLRARGQQTPIEVADLGEGHPGGRYGLISGWRRCQALRQLHAETGEARFATVLALLRRPEQSSDAYQAMVEENEIRVGLSYYERARIVVKSVDQGVFGSEKQALQQLFQSASRPKRSKIGSFLGIVRALDGSLRYPEAIAERAGLALSHALEADPGLAARLRRVLESDPAPDVAAEQAVLSAALAPRGKPEAGIVAPASAPVVATPAVSASPDPAPDPAPLSHPDVQVGDGPDGSLMLRGSGVTPALRAALERWLARGDW
ncbi:ParB N-terminal domain-containing protein [Puniceibacterium sp. IMCC21224]|uniref:ParB/RepB/Spo0J family partition protein n=1 Tax=Puniceibacterium sp. IMCC21224 TaxID=1618204 RepID=UPI00064DEEE7|nr:ParB N-terminal domain-containing protein [Puniceibacterium sp. IMCC21224]KMK63971.1 ParB-like nuclease [Puniceibacterium sp. IMCC21224]